MRKTAMAALAIALAACSAGPAHAQFGKNKVQYEALEWLVLETPHVRLHYYAAEESLARPLAAFAESVCAEYDGRFQHVPRRPIPILLFSHHHIFQQTNAAIGLIGEGTGGLTELIKGRVLIPHNGSWHRLRWVTRHELVHAYMLDKISTVMRDHHRTQGYLPPLWFTEGLAEYGATTWDEDAEGLLRDAVLTGNAYPLTESDPILGTVLMYKEGQSFLLWLSRRYGRDKVFRLLDNWWRADDFETVFRISFGVPVADLDREWFEDIKQHYYPYIASGRSPVEVGRKLTQRGRFNLGARVLPNADPADTSLRFCYFEAGETSVDLMVNLPAPGGKRKDRRVVRGHQSATFESFHLFQNRPDASPGGMLAIASRRGARDVLYLVDSKKKKIARTFEFPTLIACNDPALAPGDSSMVFSGIDYGGRADLYRTAWRGNQVTLERLTRDPYDDIEPDVTPDGRWVVFASDRGERGGRFSLFRQSLETGSIEAVSHPPSGDDRQPVVSPDGRWIAYRSTRGGSSDLWVRGAEGDSTTRRVTRLLGPATDPDWLPGGRGLLFTAQSAITFEIFETHFDPDTLAAEAESVQAPRPTLPQIATTQEPEPYARQLAVDFVSTAVGFEPGMPLGGGGQIAVSDVLGNEQIVLSLANDAQRFGNFWDGWQGGITYWNQARRLHYGVGIFRLTEVYDLDLDDIRRERRVGFTGLVRYPFNRFTRVDASILVRHASDHRLRSGGSESVDLVSNFLTLTHDNARWTLMGPTVGTRVSVTGGVTRDLTRHQGDFVTLAGEMRQYLPLAPNVVSATRALAVTSVGRDAQRSYLGGYYSIRGYERRSFSGDQTLLVQQEVRFPLLRGLALQFPGPIRFPAIRGVTFADAAWAWNGPFPVRAGAIGTGVAMGGIYFPELRVNFIWVTPDFHTYSHRPHTEFVIGFGF